MRFLVAVLFLMVSLAGFGACNGEIAFSSYDGRQYILVVPAHAHLDSAHPLPLIIAMHGFGSDAPAVEDSFQLDSLADELGFFVVYPRGSLDPSGRRFFSATDACCDFYKTGVNDVAFIDGLIDHLEAQYPIDPRRIYAVGYSNGGFMSFRLACDLAPRLAAIVSLEGAMWNDPSRCNPSAPIAVLEVHGSADTTINPDGGDGVNGFPGYVYPSVAATMLDWQRFEGCSSITTTGPSPGEIDSVAGPVDVERWEGCNATVEHWTIEGGTHSPALTRVWPSAIVTFLMAQTKPPRVTTTAPAAAESL